ncbi:MAG: hypothetical protein ACOC10_02640, partial [Bacteroidota bacterium]
MKTRWLVFSLFLLAVMLNPDANASRDSIFFVKPPYEYEFSNSTPKKQPLAEPLYHNTTGETGKNESKFATTPGNRCSIFKPKRDIWKA